VTAAPGLEVGAAAEALEVAQRVVADEHDIAAAATVAAVGTALGHVGLAPEAEATVAAGSGPDVDARSILHASIVSAEAHPVQSRRPETRSGTSRCPLPNQSF